MIRRRTGWPTTASASAVVKPTPKNADRAWKREDSCDIPVSVSATAPTRAISSDASRTTKTVTMAIVPRATRRGGGSERDRVR
jgi:hypothetical protein